VLRAGRIQGEGFVVSGVQKKLEPLLLHIWHTKNCQKWNRIEKVTTSQYREGSRTQKNKPPNTTKPKPDRSKKFLVCCSVASRVSR